MANLMYMDMGMSVLTGASAFISNREDYKLKRSIRRYEERMAKLSEALSLNAITSNENQTIEQNVFANVSIQSAKMQEQASFDVEAAAAGIVGNSVNVGRAQLEADASRAQTSRRRKFQHTMATFGQQRQQVKLQTVYGRDISPIAKPNIGAALFGIATNLIDTWDAHNPKSRQTSTLLNKGK